MSSDLFTAEIIKDTLIAIADEVFVSIARTSRSSNIYETLDYSCGITNEKGETIAEASGAPIFSGLVSSAVKVALRTYEREGTAEGDVVMMNDPLSAGTHLNDVTLIVPVFHRGERVAFVASKCHWMDVGGNNPGSWRTNSTEIFQEGILIPPVKLLSAGRVNEDLLKLLRQNIRIPSEERAQIAALTLGVKRITNLCGKYGLSSFRRATQNYLDYASKISRKALRNLPKGSFKAEDYMDNDGISDEPVHVRVNVSINDQSFKVDFSGSSPQTKGPFNCSLVATTCGARIVYKAIVDPHGPANDGYFRPLRVFAPEGSVFNAQRPSPFSNYYEVVSYASDLICKALSPVIPQLLPAGGSMSPCPTLFAGKDDEGQTFVIHEDHYGGWGAHTHRDGDNVLCPYIDGDTRLFSAEILEAKYPLLIEEYSLNTLDRSGAGKFRGGLGCVKEYRILSENIHTLTGVFSRSKFPPWGVKGGRQGSCNYILLFRDGKSKPLRRDKLTAFQLRIGDRVRLVTGNGGGYGNPLEREPGDVARDVKEGYISPKEAHEVYVVVLRKGGEVDISRTSALRKSFHRRVGNTGDKSLVPKHFRRDVSIASP